MSGRTDLADAVPGTVTLMPAKKQGEASKKWPAWAGDADDLRRLARVMDDLIEGPLREEFREIEAEEAENLEVQLLSVQDRWADKPELLASLEADQRRAMDQAIQSRQKRASERSAVEVEATERELSMSYIGTLDDVLDDVDPAAVGSIRMSAGSSIGPGRVAVHFGSRHGVNYAVRGSDRRWVLGPKGLLEQEIQKRTPRWGYARHEVAAPVLATGIALVVLIVFLAQGKSGIDYFAEGLLAGAVLGTFSVLSAAGLLLLARRALPGFELLLPGQRSKGYQRVRWLGNAIMGSLILGVVGNLIAARLDS